MRHRDCDVLLWSRTTSGLCVVKPADASLTFIRMMDVNIYINKLLANNALRERILRHMTRIIQLLSHPECEIIAQIEFHPDYIEVSGGQFFRISSWSFTDCPANLSYGKISPRVYIPYDSTTPLQRVYFKSGIKNSFPELPVRTAFLNKFYQCFLGRRMPQKIRKLVVSGPRDSGKTSWACVLHRIISSDRIASITKERQFSASMINDETELVIIDDWSGHTMGSDLAKTLLQGGWFITARKHQQPKCVWNNSPFYITTNLYYLPFPSSSSSENEKLTARLESEEASNSESCNDPTQAENALLASRRKAEESDKDEHKLSPVFVDIPESDWVLNDDVYMAKV